MSLKPAGDLDFGADSDPNVGEFAVSTMSSMCRIPGIPRSIAKIS